MNLDKAKKRIAKQVKKGFKGYPQITITYFGTSKDCATEVAVQFLQEETGEVQEERFNSDTDARESEVIQTVLLKIIERANAHSVIEVEEVSLL
ncbi:hypothetical protein [Vibrio genomosp. F10]|uniref:Uncharacterized protein n=2 Tax=Vibrio genomosp. F10 TaxID=723171 RepID=A0A1B9R229_9VIBR|nr:hypothetical protein [Vibrio genomosp. F10]OCH78252.1 hypothetical protein A6E14_05415 [Vibrio genomosp. F10]OEE30797.1 hypothetical protein A1QO_15820 [Vibrio genomosp. F10 str. ZF-129]OEE92744.1 hypothetical protein A1QM_11635 [Vibrio genomosp. F10 str. 9ZC157]OEF01235.1 hypothetical protein A1QK_11265 [Vibrio genomosp. F10 str. 9ZD137]OEF05392.1 hypothetical protein A1QI_08505 [Vibrio genomosp. F10 str. 9ZB36]